MVSLLFMPSSLSTSLWTLRPTAACLLVLTAIHAPSVYASAAQPPNVPTTRMPTTTAVAASTGRPAVPPANSNRPMTAQQYIQQQHELRQDIKKMQQQVDQIAEAHQAAMTQNQALQLANDNLSVQVKVLQSEQSAQMFLYGAATIGMGGIMGFILGNVMARRQRRW